MFKKILDWLGPNLDVYKVENANDVGAGLVRHKWQGEQTATQIGTTLTSDILNNFQKGLIPFVETSRTAGTNKDIYSITVIGLKEFGIFEGLKILIQIDNQNQYDDVVIKTDNTEYPLYIIKNGVGISPKKGYLRNKNFYFITFKGNAFYLNTGNTFGTEEDTFLEGKRLSEIIGLEFGGNIQDTGMKSVEKFYFDTVNKYYYECIVNNNLTYNDVTKFRPISNKPLSDKLENLYTIETHVIFGHLTQAKVFKIGRLCILSMDSNDAWKGVTAGTVLFTLPVGFRPLHYTVAPLGQLGTTENAGVQIETDGRVIYRGHQSIKGALYFNVVYLVK